MLCSRVDELARSVGSLKNDVNSLKDDVAQLSKVSAQTCSGVVDLHPRVGQVEKHCAKLKTSFTRLVGLLGEDAEQQQA